GFFSTAVNSLLATFDSALALPLFEFILPVGISFYTFQSMSYTIDVYRGEADAEHNFARFALYITFFPQLVAGPIERSTRLLPQLRQFVQFDYQRVTSGLRLIAWGYFKKVVIADRVGVLVDQVYATPQDTASSGLIIATILFAIQIYCDFSGYSDIAIGCARMIGIDLMTNFRQPYFSSSLREFWRRWHISLSTWFRDYVYVPLGGGKVTRYLWYRNLLIVFVVSGLWHGANWTFIVWGAIHGVGLILENVIQTAIQQSDILKGRFAEAKWMKPVQIALTFFIVTVAWIFFRANSISEANYIVTHLFTNFDKHQYLPAQWSVFHLSLSAIFISIMFFIEWLYEKRDLAMRFMNQPIWLRWSAYLVLVLTIIIFGHDAQGQFIYFQF
ncbi:MAG: MBOAT family O-acyltransferase, partial [Candidatus Promineifilaceae bacterium]